MSYRPYSNIISTAASLGSKSIRFEIQNDSGIEILALQPVASDGSGKIKAINPSIESDALKTVGVAESAISNGSYGYIQSQGKIENVTTTLDFGDYAYVSKTGLLTGTLPSEGVDGFVSGDFIVRIGIVVKNQANPSQKDLLINIGIVGQL